MTDELKVETNIENNQWTQTIQDLRDGSQEARTRFYYEHLRYLTRVLWDRARRLALFWELPDEEAQEVVANTIADTLVWAMANIGRYDSGRGASVRTWMVGIGESRLRRAVGKAVQLRRREVPDRGEAMALADPAPRPEEELMRSELRARIVATLSALKPEHRMAIVLVDMDGWSMRQLADRRGSSEEAASSLTRRARAAFLRLWRGGF